MNKQLISVQGLRLIAASMVVFVHALATYDVKVSPLPAGLEPHGMGEFGVKLFFCISGFIIYTTSGHVKAGIDALVRFFRKRLIRIVPMYWIATSIYAAKLTLQGNAPGWGNFTKSLLFIPYAGVDGLMRPVLGAGWSLNVEMMFYLVFGLALFSKPTYRIWLVTTILFALLLWHYGAANVQSPVYLITDYYLLYFLAGLFIARFNNKQILRRFAFPPMQALAICVAGITTCFIVVATAATNGLLQEAGMFVTCIACLSICAQERPSAAGERSVPLGLITLGGDASYCTYLTHGFVLGPTARLIDLSGTYVDPTLYALLMVIACNAFGALLYLYLEKPLLHRLSYTATPGAGRDAPKVAPEEQPQTPAQTRGMTT